MKCSVCAQDIPEDGYAEHLETEHGVTDDPTAVLIQHLTGLHSRDADAEDVDVLPDEEPGDADAFGEFFAGDAEDGDDDEGAAADAEPEGEETDEDAVLAEDEHVDEAEEQLTDDDEAEFDRMLAAYPDVDLRKGRPTPSDDDESDEDADRTERVPAAAVAAAGAVGAAAAASDLDAHDEKTFAVWDEARGAADGDALPVTATGVEDDDSRRRRQAALLGLAAAIVLIAIAVVYLLTRDTSSKKTAATSPSTLVTTSPTFLPGPANGAPTTVPATTTPTQPPVTSATATPATPATTAATTATTAAPSGDPRSQISFPSMRGACSNGQLSVAGSVVNNNPQAYSFSFTITFASSAGTVLGTANGSVAHLPGHATGPFSASGSCSNVNGAASKTVQITSITPG